MNEKTPTRRSVQSTSGFSPVIVQTSPAAESPQKNLTGHPRVIRDIVADLYNNVQRWNSLHIQGCGIVKQIASMKADTGQTYPPHLDEHINELQSVVQSMTNMFNVFAKLDEQATAFAKLPNLWNPLFFSMDAFSLTRLIKDICEVYMTAFKAKLCVLENIGHSKTHTDAMFWAISWTYEVDIDEDTSFKLQTLLVECGHTAI
ncbi:hypothetical protein HUJ04_004694, partial [Dendroctonus ponderosae]